MTPAKGHIFKMKLNYFSQLGGTVAQINNEFQRLITVELFQDSHTLVCTSCVTHVNEVFQNVLILWIIYFTAQYKA